MCTSVFKPEILQAAAVKGLMTGSSSFVCCFSSSFNGCLLFVCLRVACFSWFVCLLLPFVPSLSLSVCLCLSLSLSLSPSPPSLSLPSLYGYEEGAGVVVDGWVGERGASRGVVDNMKIIFDFRASRCVCA